MKRLASLAVILTLVLVAATSALAQEELTITTFDITAAVDWYTDDGLVTLTLTALPAPDTTIDWFALMEQGEGNPVPTPQPTDWQDWNDGLDFPLTTTLTEEGLVTLHVFLKDSLENEVSASDSIVHLGPVIIMEPLIVPSAYSAIVSWQTEKDNEELADAISWIEYREAGSEDPYEIAGPTDYGEQNFEHTITITGLLDETEYELVLHSNCSVLDKIDEEPITVITTAPEPTEGDVIWSGAVGNTWAYGRNWVDQYPPANPTPGRLLFPLDGESDATPAEGDEWSVGSVVRQLTTAEHLGTHTIDLAGKTVEVADEIVIRDEYRPCPSGDKNLSFRNGTLRIGKSLAERGNIRLSGMLLQNSDAYVVELKVNSDVALEPYIGNIEFNECEAARSVIDLSGVQLVESAAGVLNADNILIRQGGRVEYAALVMDETTGISDLVINNTLQLAGHANVPNEGERVWTVRARIGYPDPEDGGEWKLPSGMNLKIGDALTESRGNLLVGSPRMYNRIDGHLTMNGGDFVAYLQDLDVGRCDAYGHAGPNRAEGLLDLRNVGENFLLEAVNVRIGATNEQINSYGYGTMYLPAVTAKTANLTVGQGGFANDDGFGVLNIDGGTFEVSSSLKLGKKGTIIIDVGGESCGIDLTGTLTADANADGIVINFNALETTPSAMYYGLRWAGSHVSELGDLNAAGKLRWTIDESIEGKKVGVYSDELYTYVALVDETTALPPVAVAKNFVTLLVDGEAVVTPMDLDNGSYDPDGGQLTYKLTYGELVEVDQVILTEGGDHQVTLVVINPNDLRGQAVATVSVMLEAAWRAMDLSWSGADEAGGEWSRQNNWLYAGVPMVLPVPNPATGTFTLPLPGTAILDPDGDTWTVGIVTRDISRTDAATQGTYAIDLNGKTLHVTSQLRIYDNSARSFDNSRILSFSNGTLRIGAGSPASVILNGQADWYESRQRDLRLNLSSDVALDPNISTFEISGWYQRSSAWDIRGVQLVPEANGLMHMTTLNISSGSGTQGGAFASNEFSAILMDDDTGVDTLSVATLLRLGGSNTRRCFARIGNPDDGWKLPSGVSVRVGDKDGARGNIYIAANRTDDGVNGALILNGGDFEAHVTDLRLANDTPSNNGQTGIYSLTEGLLDLTNVGESFYLNATSVLIGTTGTNDNSKNKALSKGTVRLPAGTVNFGTVTMGSLNTVIREGCFGLLELNGTDVKIATSLTLKKDATIVTNVGSTSSGIDLAGSMTVEDTTNEIAINFLEMPAGSGLHYGLRWVGDNVAALEAMRDAVPSKLTVDISAVTALDPTATWSIIKVQEGPEGEEVDVTYVVLNATAPNVSTYTLSAEVPGNVSVGIDADLEITVETDQLGELGYPEARVSFAASGPGDVTVSSGEYSEVNTGVLPDQLVLDADDSETVNAVLNFSACGDYTITFTCHEPGEEADPFATGVLEVSISIYADATRDSSVDLLDLVFVRNRLFVEDPEGHDARADITNDGTVDLDDLIEVRNNLGASCE